MNIKHITFLDSDNNYGQILQCFALQKYLQNLGHDVQLINYCQNYRNGGKSKSVVKKVAELPGKIAQGRVKEKLLAKRNTEIDKARSFDTFISENINRTKEYDGIASLRNDPPQAEVYICGSDQIWGANLLLEDSAAWFLSFGDDNVRRIAYAPSIGRDYTEEEEKIFKGYLARFQAISVREKSAAQVCAGVGYPATVVVDPTLLLDSCDYLNLSSKYSSSSQEYLFAYILNVRKKEDVAWGSVSEYLSKKHLKLRTVYSSGYLQARQIISKAVPEYPTVEEWLALIRDSQSVMTTSFHGAVFSVLLHKPFIAFKLRDKPRANDRLTTFLDNLGLSGRVYNASRSFDSQMDEDINWEDVDERLGDLREHARTFLAQALVSDGR